MSDVVPSSPAPDTPAHDEPRRIGLPLALLLATCASTFFAGATHWEPFLVVGNGRTAWDAALRHWQPGLLYMAAVMGILLTHEMGHFLLAVRHRIPASLPYFIPVPFLPFGTMGAVIGMSDSHANRRQLFDLGLAGPLAGLMVAIPVAWIGIQQLPLAHPSPGSFGLHPPLIFKLMMAHLHPDYPAGMLLDIKTMNPWLMAGWVGMLITGLNMLPISQLDGGHVAYALLGPRACVLGRAVLVAAILYILGAEKYGWVLMVVLVTLMGTDHPSTADDAAPLGWPRTIVGWASLAIPVLCFAPQGISAT